jgi:hypothetical protein
VANYVFSSNESLNAQDGHSTQGNFIVPDSLLIKNVSAWDGPSVVLESVDASTKGYLGLGSPFAVQINPGQTIALDLNSFKTLSPAAKSHWANYARKNLLQFSTVVANAVTVLTPDALATLT